MIMPVHEQRENTFDRTFDSCGHSDVSDRIVGGQNASLGAHPWIAVLGYGV